MPNIRNIRLSNLPSLKYLNLINIGVSSVFNIPDIDKIPNIGNDEIWPLNYESFITDNTRKHIKELQQEAKFNNANLLRKKLNPDITLKVSQIFINKFF